MLDPGVLIDERHEIEHLLGRGATAEVFRARDTRTGRPVAIKVLRSIDPHSMTRHRGEIEVLSRLDHPGVVRLLGTGAHDGAPYLVLDLVDGPSLADVLDNGPLDLDRSISIGHQLAEALAHAHGLGVIHRDLKPANVLIDADPTSVRLADFGIARFNDTTRITATGHCIGTAAYLAPEQLQGQIGPAADIYALGLVIIECLTGTLCYPGTAPETITGRLHRSPAIPVDLPAWLGHTLQAMTARDPRHRPPAGAASDAFRCRSVDPILASTAEVDITALSGRAPPGTATHDITDSTTRPERGRAADRPWDARTTRRPLLLAFGSGALTSAAVLALTLMVGPFAGTDAQATEPQIPPTSTPIPAFPAPSLPTRTAATPTTTAPPPDINRHDANHDDGAPHTATSHTGDDNGDGRGRGHRQHNQDRPGR